MHWISLKTILQWPEFNRLRPAPPSARTFSLNFYDYSFHNMLENLSGKSLEISFFVVCFLSIHENGNTNHIDLYVGAIFWRKERTHSRFQSRSAHINTYLSLKKIEKGASFSFVTWCRFSPKAKHNNFFFSNPEFITEKCTLIYHLFFNTFD